MGQPGPALTSDHAFVHMGPPSGDLPICGQPRAGQHLEHVAPLQQGGWHLVLAGHTALRGRREEGGGGN